MYSNGAMVMESTWNYSMESIWIVPWSPHGLFHGVHGGYACIPYGIHDDYGIRKQLRPQPMLIPWTPHGIPDGFHGSHMDSTWNDEFHDHSIIIPHGIHDDYGIRKQLRPQPMLIPWTPHGIPDGFHGFHMDSTWNNLGKVKTSTFEVKKQTLYPVSDIM